MIAVHYKYPLWAEGYTNFLDEMKIAVTFFEKDDCMLNDCCCYKKMNVCMYMKSKWLPLLPCYGKQLLLRCCYKNWLHGYEND